MNFERIKQRNYISKVKETNKEIVTESEKARLRDDLSLQLGTLAHVINALWPRKSRSCSGSWRRSFSSPIQNFSHNPLTTNFSKITLFPQDSCFLNLSAAHLAAALLQSWFNGGSSSLLKNETTLITGTRCVVVSNQWLSRLVAH